MKEIRRYYSSYNHYNHNKWSWEPLPYHRCSEDQGEWNKRFLATRARYSIDCKNEDLLMPDYHSLERDAEQFGLKEYTFTDTFGLSWYGKKGVFEKVGLPDYEGHLYYCDECSDYANEDGYVISDEYSMRNPPSEEIYERFGNDWLDIKNIVDIRYYYIVENHLFKDSRIDILYDDKEENIFDTDFRTFVKALKKFGKTEVFEKLMKSINEHFDALKNSDREEERAFYPDCTAEEYFEKN